MASMKNIRNGAVGRLHENCRKNIVCMKPSV